MELCRRAAGRSTASAGSRHLFHDDACYSENLLRVGACWIFRPTSASASLERMHPIGAFSQGAASFVGFRPLACVLHRSLNSTKISARSLAHLKCSPL